MKLWGMEIHADWHDLLPRRLSRSTAKARWPGVLSRPHRSGCVCTIFMAARCIGSSANLWIVLGTTSMERCRQVSWNESCWSLTRSPWLDLKCYIKLTCTCMALWQARPSFLEILHVNFVNFFLKSGMNPFRGNFCFVEPANFYNSCQTAPRIQRCPASLR